MPTWVRREHSPKFIEHSEGANLTRTFKASSDKRHAPLRDMIPKPGQLLVDRVKVSAIMSSQTHCPPRSNWKTYKTKGQLNLIINNKKN